jgi:hypothetical protein
MCIAIGETEIKMIEKKSSVTIILKSHQKEENERAIIENVNTFC